MESVILQSLFHVAYHTRESYHVTLTRTALLVEPRVSVLTKDLLGLKAVSVQDILYVEELQKDVSGDVVVGIHLICYMKDEKSMKRSRRDLEFFIVEGTTADKLQTARMWCKGIRWLVHDPLINLHELEAKEIDPPVRRYLVLINPISGRGKAMTDFKQKVEPMMKSARTYYETIVTERKGHAHEIAFGLDMTKFDAVLLCAGDGLGYEFINGLMNRDDWNAAIKVPLGYLPAGTGNAVSTANLSAIGEACDIISATFVALRGRSRPINLCSFENQNGRFYGLLSLSWTFSADLNVETEHMRALGATRFALGALRRIVFLRTYTGSLSYLPCDNGTMDLAVREVDSTLRLQEVDNNLKQVNTLKLGSSTEGQVDVLSSSSDLNLTESNSFRETATKDQLKDLPLWFKDSKGRVHDPSDCLLPHPSAPVPDNWHSVSGEFVFFLVLLVSHFGENLTYAPETKICDSSMCLAYVKKGVTRGRFVSILKAMVTGMRLPELTSVRIKAFRLEPDLNTVGNMQIDGDSIEYGPIQGQLHQGMARILSF